jgi:ATP-dependent DNA helicase RecG
MPVLLKSGVVERIGRKYLLSRKYYEFVDRKGVYTRKRGLDRETNKQLLLKHIKENRDSGSRLKELMQVLPALTMPQVQTLLRELKSEGKIYKVGSTRAALWYPGPETDGITSGKNG